MTQSVSVVDVQGPESRKRLAELAKVIPGGFNSAGREMHPQLVFREAFGATITDADGREYLDFHAAYGPVLLGHCYPDVVDFVSTTLQTQNLIGIGGLPLEGELAAQIVKHIPSAEMVHLCNSGTEASLHSLHLVRGLTGRRIVVKFQGCNHGWHDFLGMNIISPEERFGHKDPISAGMHAPAQADTIVLEFNDLEGIDRLFTERGEEIAAVYVEPIAHNVGCLMPAPGFLERLRELTAGYGSVLVFDEIITGFRHHIGGYQSIHGIKPDLTLLAKALGNGFPISAVCGSSRVLDASMTAGGDVAVVGTYNGHPVGVAAALATIDVLEREDVHTHIYRLGERMRAGLREIVNELAVPAQVSGFGSIFALYFLEGEPQTYRDLLANDADRYIAFAREMIARGFFVVPLNLKRAHISYSMSDDDIDRALEASRDSLRAVFMESD
jgi:glutamate-1-semialdehyde 2,1-aminomutase